MRKTGTVLCLLLAASGLVVTAAALVLGRPKTGLAGLALTLSAGLCLFAHLRRVRRDLLERQALLQELNQSLDEQVQARTERLMQTIENLESFNRMVTHDLRSPLSGLLAGLDLMLLKLDQEGPEELRARLDRLVDQACRARDLIEGLQHLALVSGRLPTVQSVDVSICCQQILRQLQQKEPQRSVRWTIEPELTVLGDPNLIRIGLENVVGNAWKYTVERPLAEIAIRRGAGPGRVIEIQDNGMGFDMAKADRLFEPFHRLHTETHIPGHGIGLSIVKRVVLKHGGRVSAEGRPGEGATFRLEFPEQL